MAWSTVKSKINAKNNFSEKKKQTNKNKTKNTKISSCHGKGYTVKSENNATNQHFYQTKKF